MQRVEVTRSKKLSGSEKIRRQEKGVCKLRRQIATAVKDNITKW
jgi:hypothetical protein